MLVPEGPRSANDSPRWIFKDTSFKMTFSPYRRVTFRSSTSHSATPVSLTTSPATKPDAKVDPVSLPSRESRRGGLFPSLHMRKLERPVPCKERITLCFDGKLLLLAAGINARPRENGRRRKRFAARRASSRGAPVQMNKEESAILALEHEGDTTTKALGVAWRIVRDSLVPASPQCIAQSPFVGFNMVCCNTTMQNLRQRWGHSRTTRTEEQVR